MLRTTPALEPSDNRLEVNLESRLGRDGTLSSEITIRPTGFLETALRRGLVGGPVADRLKPLLEIVRALSPAARTTRTRITPTDLGDLDEPLVAAVTVEVPGWAVPAADGRLAFVPPAFRHPVRHRRLWENLLVTGAAARSRGLSFSCPKEIILRGELRLPRRYRLVSPRRGSTVENPLGTASWSIELVDGDRLVTEQRAVFRTRRVEAAQLKDYERLVAPLQALETAPVLLAPEGDR